MGGNASGRIYQLDYADKYTDDSEGTPQVDGNNKQVIPPTNPLPIRWYWRTDDISLDSLQNIVQVDRINVATEFEANGTLDVSFGYDGYHDQATKNLPVSASRFILGSSILGSDLLGGFRFTTKSVRPLGRGNSFNLKLGGISLVAAEVTKFTLAGRQAATKVSGVR